MPKEKIFLSAVTAQLKACRDALRSDLAAVGAEVVVQEDFQQHGGTLLEKLEQYIGGCDRVIALVGTAYGWKPEPAATPENASPRSYTQWEYHFARGERLDGTRVPAKPVYVYFATPAYLEQHPVTQPDAEARRQQAFVDAIEASGKDRNYFDSIDHLARLVLRDGFRLSSAGKWIPQNLPYDSLGSLFTGRDAIVSEIQAQLSGGREQAAAIVAKQAIHGLGGVGKTRLAVEYAWHHLGDYAACLFVGADSPENLERNLAGLCEARLLDLPERAAREQEFQVAAALRWLQGHSGWLLVLDNVDSPEAATAVDRLLPALQNGHVLITSRRTDWGGAVRTLALDTLDEEAAVAFLLERTERRTETDGDEDAALALARTLDGLALALEQAGAFINKKRIGLGEYLARWERQEAKLRHWHDPRTMHYPYSLTVTWETSFEQLTLAARALLNLLCWFAPEPIPRETFETAFDALTLVVQSRDFGAGTPDTLPSEDLEDLLDELGSLSLVKWESGNRAFSVHRLVQEIVRARLPEEALGPSLRAAVGLINDALPSDLTPSDVRAWPVWEPLLSHIEQLVHTADDAGITDPTVLLLNELGQYLKAKGLLAAAEPLMRRALEIDEASFGGEHPRVSIRLSNLAQLLQETFRLEEAEPLMRRALAIDEASFGGEHPRVANDLNNLAGLLHATNRLKEAEPLMRRALEIDEARYGSEHPRVATDLNNLAGLLQATNRLEEAESLMRRALAIGKASYGDEHPWVARHLSNLALLLKETNRLEEAESLMRRALEIDEASYGTDHPTFAIDLNNFAQLLQATNRMKESESLLRRALAINEATFGSEHPSIAITLNNLARLFQDTSRLEEAEPLIRRALEIVEASYGAKHPSVADPLNNLTRLLQKTNRLEEAEPLIRRALEIDEASFGGEHPKVARDLSNLARLLQDTDRLEEAEFLMHRALAIDEAGYGGEHPRVAADLNNLAQMLQATNRLEEAEPLMRRALKIDEASYGAEHPDVAIGLNNLAGLLQITNRLEEAEPLSRRHFEIFLLFALRTGHKHPHLDVAFKNYRTLLAAMGHDEGEQRAAVKSLIESVKQKIDS